MGWADALSGLGAGLQGQGAQWQVAHNDRLKTLSELDDKRKQAMLEDFRSTLVRLKSGDTGGASQLLQDRLEAITQLGGDPSDTAEINRMIQEGRIDEAVAGLQSIDDMAVVNGKLPSMELGGEGTPSNVQEFMFWQSLPPEQQQQYMQVKRAQQIIDMGGGASGIVQGNQAVPIVQAPGQTIGQVRADVAGAEAGLAGATSAASEYGKLGAQLAVEPAITSANTAADLGAQAEYRPSMESAVTSAVEGAKVAATESGEAYKSYSAIRNSLGTYDKAIAAIDKGATTGKIASLFPTIRASTIELENLRNKLGLDVVAASKFGALSAGELSLALETAVPNLPAPELRQWLVGRKAAQQKMADYYKDVAIYLGKPGNTLGSYLAQQEAKQAPTQNGDIPEVPAAIDNSRSGAVLLEDANGNRAYQYPDGRIEEIN